MVDHVKRGGGAALAALVVVSCTSPPSLHDHIVASQPKPCDRADCINPHILAVEDGYELTTAFRGAFTHHHVRADDLSRALRALPMSAWPRGPEILITPTDVVDDGPLVQVRVRDAERICRELGLTPTIRPGG